MITSLQELSPLETYHLMTQTIIPRPIAWILTESGHDNYNLAPFSYFTAVSSAPSLIMVSIGKKGDNTQKDTLINVKKKKKLIIHIAPHSLAQEVTDSAAPLSYGESEVTKNNLQLTPFDKFPLPRLVDAPVAFACSLYEVKEIGDAPQSLLFAKIEHIYTNDSIVTKDTKGRLKIDASSVTPLCRLGANEYAQLGKVFTLERPN